MVFGTCRSICVWDLREAKLHHQEINGLPCPLRSPSYNSGTIQFINLKKTIIPYCFNAVRIVLALSIDHGHMSKIVGISTVTYKNVTNEKLPDEVRISKSLFTISA